MMLAKLLICSILIFLARGTFITSQTCTTHTQCTNDGESPHTTQQNISPQQNTLIRGKAGPKGLKGERGDRGKTDRRGRDCNEAKINTKITQFESIVKYNIAALERVTAKNEANITNSQNNIEALERVTAKNQADITQSQNNIAALERVTAKNEANITNSQNNIETLERVTKKNKADITNSQNNIEALERVTAKNQADITTSQNQILNLTTELDATITTSKDEIKSLKMDLDVTQTALNQSLIEIQTLKREIEKNEVNIMASNEEIQALRTELIATQTSLNQSNDKIATMEASWNIFKGFFTDKVRLNSCGFLRSPSEIGDSKLTASSYIDDDSAPKRGRLFGTSGYGAWMPKTLNGGDWIQVDLGKDERIVAVVTQGRYHHDEWTTSYKVSFKVEGGTFNDVTDNSGNFAVFQGNTDQNTPVINSFTEAIIARYVRIIPLTFRVDSPLTRNGWPSMRFDLLKC